MSRCPKGYQPNSETSSPCPPANQTTTRECPLPQLEISWEAPIFCALWTRPEIAKGRAVEPLHSLEYYCFVAGMWQRNTERTQRWRKALINSLWDAPRIFLLLHVVEVILMRIWPTQLSAVASRSTRLAFSPFNTRKSDTNSPRTTNPSKRMMQVSVLESQRAAMEDISPYSNALLWSKL